MNTQLGLLTLSPQETAAAADGTAGPTIRGWRWSAGEVLPPFVASIQLQRLANNEEWFWCAARIFIHFSTGCVIGSGAFKHSPRDGTVEIGYGVIASSAGKGYATQGVAMLLTEAFARPDIRAVTAETSVDNFASQRVLEKNGFRRVGRREDADDGPLICWRIERP